MPSSGAGVEVPFELKITEEYGGPGADFVSQALVMAELARGDSAISKAFSQNWKWSHLIASACTPEQKKRFLSAFLADDTFVMGKGITEPNAGSDNRLPPDDDVRAGLKLKAQYGPHWAEIDAGNGMVFGLHPPGKTTPAPGQKGAIQVGLSVTQSLDKVVPELTRRGVAFSGPIIDDPKAALRLAYFSDLDGNPLYLIELPNARHA